jgi:hypothetical protein
MMRAGIGLVAAAMVAHAAAVHAAPLEKEECAKLKGEQAQLEQSGVRSSMGRGPEWAKANLSSERLEQVRRVIELDEQLLFRCQGKPLVTFREASDPDPAATGPRDPAKAPAPNAVKAPVKRTAVQPAAGAVKGAPKVPPAAKKTAAPAPSAPPSAAPAKPAAPAPAAEGGAKKAEPAKEAKAKPKRKTPDSNSADWITNPFADMLAPAKK